MIKSHGGAKQPQDLLFKIGAVSELSGVPVTTLRDWEIRYGALQPHKTSTGHRMYRQVDLERARLFKQLSGLGQSIGSIAKLDINQLEELLGQFHLNKHQTHHQNSEAAHYSGGLNADTNALSRHGPSSSDISSTVQATSIIPFIVVGSFLAKRLNSSKFTQHLRRIRLDVQQVFQDNLSAKASSHLFAHSDKQSVSTRGVLITEQNEIHAQSVAEITQLAKSFANYQVIVLYQYAPSFWVQELKSKGITLKREPITDADLAQLINSFLVVDFMRELSALSTHSGAPAAEPLNLIPPRKYSKETLSQFATYNSNIFCECPQHVCELLERLSGFEKYSQECLSLSTEDAELHAFLTSVSGSARVLFERALEHIAKHEGITIPRE
jgi:DNA-binding transcriptional MerR regulator